MVQVGQLSVKLEVDRGSKSAFVKDMGDAKKAASDVGEELTKSEAKGSKALSGLAATAKRVLPALSIGAVIGAGWNRFTGIENAEQQLKGLGNSAAETKSIMDSTLAAVKGTAFGLDEAASAAATATAAGVKSGEELQKYLTLVGDIAAITNSSYAETADAMNRAVTVGAAYNDTLRILSQRGLPVYSLLSKEIGITTAEVKKLASEGKISAETLENALAGQVGGAALKMGETTSGQLKNVGAALSRVGADILSGIMPTVKALSDGVIFLADGFGKLPGPVKAATVSMAAFVALQKAGLFTKLASGAETLVTQLKLIKSEGLAASGALGTLGKVGGLLLLTQAASTAYLTFQKLNGEVGKVPGLVDDATLSISNNAVETARAALAPYVKELSNAGLTVDEVAAAMVQGGQKAADYARMIADAQSYLGGVADRASIWANSLSFGVISESDAVELQRIISDTGQSIDDFYANMREQHLLAENVVVDGFGAMNAVSQEYLREVGLIPGPTIAMADAFVKSSEAAARAAKDQANYAKVMEGIAPASYSAGRAMNEWVAAQSAAADEAERLRGLQQDQLRSMVALHGAAADLGESFGDLKGSLFDANGELDLSRSAVRDLVSGMQAYGQSAADAAQATYDQTGSLDQAAAVADQARGAFIDLMMAQGATRGEAERLAQQMGILDSITIFDKVFTITAIDNASAVMSRIAQLASMLGIQTASSAGSAMADWLRKNPGQIGAAFQSAIADSVKITATSSSSGGGGGGGRGGGGKSAAETAAEKAAAAVKKAFDKVGVPLKEPFDLAEVGVKRVNRQIAAAEKALERFADDLTPKQVAKMERQIKAWRQSVVDQTIEIAAEKAEKRSEKLADKMRDVLSGIGKVASAPFDLASAGADTIVGQIASAGEALQRAVKKGLSKDQAKELRGELIDLAGEAGRQMKALQDKIRTDDMSALRAAVDGSVSDMRSAVEDLVEDLRSLGASSSTLGRIGVIEGRLTHLMDQREAVTKRLGEAQSHLNDLMDQYKSRVDSVTGSIQSYANITQVQATNSIGWISSVGDLIGQMGQQSSEIESFVNDIAKLRSMGLNDTTLNQLIDAGPGQGWAQARLLAGATSDEIRKVNDLADKVFGQGNRLGTMSADSMYASGISAAQAMVDGLVAEQANLQTAIETLAGDAEILAADAMVTQGANAAMGLIEGLNSKEDTLTKAMQKLGKKMVRAFKDEMGIASPSKVMAREVGAPMAEGVLEGFVKQIALGDRMTGSLRSIAVPTLRGAVAGSGAGPSGSAGALTVRLTVEGVDGPLADAIARGARVEIEDAEGRKVQADRMGSFAAVRR